MRRKRELDPEGTMSLRRECDRLSKAKYAALESEFYHKQCFVNTGKVCTTVLFILCGTLMPWILAQSQSVTPQDPSILDPSMPPDQPKDLYSVYLENTKATLTKHTLEKMTKTNNN